MLICTNIWHGIGFDRKGFFSIGDDAGESVTIFGIDMSSSSHIDNNKLVKVLHKD